MTVTKCTNCKEDCGSEIKCPKCGSNYVEWFTDDNSKCQDCKHIAPDEAFEIMVGLMEGTL